MYNQIAWLIYTSIGMRSNDPLDVSLSNREGLFQLVIEKLLTDDSISS